MLKINHEERFKQIHNLTGIIRMRGISPTDLDGVIDYGGRAFIYLEGKVLGNEPSKGQRMALENLVKSHWKAGHPSIAILYVHTTQPEEQVMVHDCDVWKVFGKTDQFNFIWKDILTSSVLEIIEKFENLYL